MKKRTTFSDQAWQSNKKSVSKVTREYKHLSERQRKNAEEMRLLSGKMAQDSMRTKQDNEKLRGGRKSLNLLTTADYIKKALANVTRGLTIAVILERIETLGWTTSNPASKYATVAGALRKDTHLFKKTGPGQFMLHTEFLKLNQRTTRIGKTA